MFYRDYHYIFDGWDEPPAPVPHRETGRRTFAERREALLQQRRNTPARVLFEIWLVIATPLALAVVVTLLLNLAGIPVGI